MSEDALGETESTARPIEILTKSRLAAFSLCQRLEFLTYQMGYRSLLPRELADWGSMFHAGLDAWWLAHKLGSLLALTDALAAMAAWRAKEGASIDDAAFAKAQVMMTAYDIRWAASMAEYEVLGVEVEFIAVVPGRKRLRIAGKLDKLLRKRSDGSVWFVETKTTGADLSPGSTYWARLRLDPQVSIYHLGCRELGYDVHGALYDVVDRPGQKPLKATPVDKRKYTKATKTEPSRLYKDQRETDETIDEYRERLAAIVMEDPSAYFARPEIVRLETELADSLVDVTELGLQIRNGPHSGVAPRNPASCFAWNRPCDFFDACSGVASLDDETKFRKEEKMHPELTEVAK